MSLPAPGGPGWRTCRSSGGGGAMGSYLAGHSLGRALALVLTGLAISRVLHRTPEAAVLHRGAVRGAPAVSVSAR